MTECDLEVNVYGCRHGILMSHACMVPPIEAERFRSCSSRLGLIRCRDLGPVYCERIRSDIESKAYSFLTSEEAHGVDVSRHILPAD